MVVIAIVAILAAVAIPSYRVYIIKAEIVESIVLARSYAKKAQEYYDINGSAPADNALLPGGNAIISPSRTVSRIGHRGMTIDISFSSEVSAVAGKVLHFSPIQNDDIIIYYCRTSSVAEQVVDESYLPQNCITFAEFDALTGTKL